MIPEILQLPVFDSKISSSRLLIESKILILHEPEIRGIISPFPCVCRSCQRTFRKPSPSTSLLFRLTRLVLCHKCIFTEKGTRRGWHNDKWQGRKLVSVNWVKKKEAEREEREKREMKCLSCGGFSEPCGTCRTWGLNLVKQSQSWIMLRVCAGLSGKRLILPVLDTTQNWKCLIHALKQLK